MADWSALPTDILIEIASRFGLPSDFVRFKAVCSSWRSTANNQSSHQFFGYVLSYDFRSSDQFLGFVVSYDFRYFFSPLDDKVYQKLLPVSYDRECRGNNGGWLVMKVPFQETIYAINPLSGVRLVFPPLTWRDEREYPDWCSSDFVEKAVLSSDPSDQSPVANDELTAMILLADNGRLAFAKQCFPNWIELQGIETSQDIAYYKGEFYAVNKQGTLYVCYLNYPQPTLQVLIPPSGEEVSKWFLVESSGRQLLQVSRKILWCDDDESHRHYSVAHLFMTCVFQVYELDLKGKKRTEIKDLGDRALFLGFNTSVSLHSPEKIGLRKNCVYYYTDEGKEVNAVGVFDLETKRCHRPDPDLLISRTDGFLHLPKPFWFTLPPQ